MNEEFISFWHGRYKTIFCNLLELWRKRSKSEFSSMEARNSYTYWLYFKPVVPNFLDARERMMGFPWRGGAWFHTLVRSHVRVDGTSLAYMDLFLVGSGGPWTTASPWTGFGDSCFKPCQVLFNMVLL